MPTGLHKLRHPAIPDGRTWSKLRKHGEHGENGEHGEHGEHGKISSGDTIKKEKPYGSRKKYDQKQKTLWKSKEI